MIDPMASGRILVTGATGFVGRHLVPSLAAKGHALTLALRRNTDCLATPKGDIRAVTIAGIGAKTCWDDALQDVSVVINLAGRAHVLKETAENPEALYMAVNRDGPIRLFTAAQEAGVKGFLHMSSIGVIGKVSPPGQPLSDNSIPAPGSAYARSKHAAELALNDMAAGGGPALVILRPPLICGPFAKGNLERLMKLVAKPLPLPFGAMRNRRTLLSIENLLSAIETVLLSWQRQPAAGTYVIADADALSTGDIVASLRQGMGAAPLLLPVAPQILDLTLRAIGRQRLGEQLLGDLEIDAAGFQSAFQWQPVHATRASLKSMARIFSQSRAHG